jgi:hypothetical protein
MLFLLPTLIAMLLAGTSAVTAQEVILTNKSCLLLRDAVSASAYRVPLLKGDPKEDDDLLRVKLRLFDAHFVRVGTITVIDGINYEPVCADIVGLSVTERAKAFMGFVFLEKDKAQDEQSLGAEWRVQDIRNQSVSDTVVLQLHVNGRPVFGAQALVGFNKRGAIISASARNISRSQFLTYVAEERPYISPDIAGEVAIRTLEYQYSNNVHQALDTQLSLVIGSDGQLRQAWVVDASGKDSAKSSDTGRSQVIIDATTRNVVAVSSTFERTSRAEGADEAEGSGWSKGNIKRQKLSHTCDKTSSAKSDCRLAEKTISIGGEIWLQAFIKKGDGPKRIESDRGGTTSSYNMVGLKERDEKKGALKSAIDAYVFAGKSRDVLLDHGACIRVRGNPEKCGAIEIVISDDFKGAKWFEGQAWFSFSINESPAGDPTIVAHELTHGLIQTHSKTGIPQCPVLQKVSPTNGHGLMRLWLTLLVHWSPLEPSGTKLRRRIGGFT